MKSSHNITRVESFSDAIFAFAATLTVLDFSINDMVLTGDEFWLNFVSFGLGFSVLVILWVTHYNFFRRTRYIDNWIICLNGLLLFVILYYQFPLRKLIKSILQGEIMGEEQLSSLFTSYGFGFVLVFLCFSLMYYRSFSQNKKQKNSITSLKYSRHFLIFVLVGTGSILLAYFKIGINFGLSGFFYAMLGPLCTWNALYFKKKIKNASSS